jgi:hypothetical protein
MLRVANGRRTQNLERPSCDSSSKRSYGVAGGTSLVIIAPECRQQRRKKGPPAQRRRPFTWPLNYTVTRYSHSMVAGGLELIS